MVTDIGGINDRSFNASAWAGMQAAQKQNANIKIDYTQSAAEADYGPNLNGYVQQRCDLIVAVGGLMAQATTDAAKAAADQNAGKRLSDQFTGQNADVIMPVAGGTGLGTAAGAQQSGGKYSVIWVDQDGCVSAAQYCSVFLSTVVKNISDAVRDAVLATAG